MYKLSHMMLILAAGLWAYSFAMLCLTAGWLGWIVLAIVARFLFKNKEQFLTTLASGRFATEQEMRSAEMLGGSGLILGWLPRKKFWERLKPILSKAPAKVICQQFMGEPELITLPPSTTHVSVFAPTGAGKNASLIMPWLLSVNESAVVVDFKGENALVTAQARERMGQRVVILDPFKAITQSRRLKRRSDTYNPLDCIEKDAPRTLDDCKALSKSIMKRPDDVGKNEHFYARAEARIGAITATTAYFGSSELGTRSLVKVADILSSPSSLKDATELMQSHPELFNGGLARMAGQISTGGGEELDSVSGTVTTGIDFMNSPEVAENLKTSSFDPRDLYRGKMTIYLVLPPEYMRSHSALLRLWISSFANVVIRGGLNKSQNTHFIIDEAGAGVGHMDCIADLLNIGRGYSARLQLYYQDYGQLEKCWPKGAAQGVLANTTSIAFGVNDNQTAKMLSERCGMGTVIVASGGSNGGTSHQVDDRGTGGSTSYSCGDNSGWQQQKREVLTPDEIMSALSPRTALTFIPGMRPVVSNLLRYYEEKRPFTPSWRRRVAMAVKTFSFSLIFLFLGAIVASFSTNFFHERWINHGGQFGGEAVQDSQAEPDERPW